MIVKRCTKEDIDLIYDIEEKSFTDPMKKETMLKDLNRESYFCYGLFEKELIAFISYEKVFDEGQIISVATKPEYRNRGLGKTLFKEVCNLAKADGIEFFSLEVRSNNIPAIMLYESMGFVKVGERKNYYQNPTCDAILMDLQLGKD